MKKTIAIPALFSLVTMSAQQLTLEQCRHAAEEHFPLLKDKNLQDELAALARKSNNTAYLPQATFNAHGSYQSDVTSVSLPIPNAPQPPAKDQYKTYLDISQTLYDGGLTRLKNDLQDISATIKKNDIDRQVRDIDLQVQRYYFAALLADRNAAVLEASAQDIGARINVLQTGFKYGTVKQSQIDILKVEKLKLGQQQLDLAASLETALRVLSVLTGIDIGKDAQLALPDAPLSFADNYENRPEWQNFSLQQRRIDQNHSLENAALRPRLSLFGQGGYGRPALNMLSNDFDFYYVAGARLNWNLSAFYTSKERTAETKVSKQSVELQKETLKLQLDTQRAAIESDIEKYRAMAASDAEIIRLRANIGRVAATELDNGVTNATDYLIEKNDQTRAELQRNLHEIQLLSAQYQLLQLTGN